MVSGSACPRILEVTFGGLLLKSLFFVFPIVLRLFSIFFCLLNRVSVLLPEFILDFFQLMMPSFIILFVLFGFFLHFLVSFALDRSHLTFQLLILLFEAFRLLLIELLQIILNLLHMRYFCGDLGHLFCMMALLQA